MMKNSIEKILLVIILGIGLVLLNSSCEKETTDVDEPVIDNPIVSTTGEATVGKAGGIISVGDASSVIYGASINIPKNALSESQNIKIIPGNKELINGVLVQTVDFLPKDLEFYEQVEIGIPWTSDNQNSSNSKVYYFDEENSNIESLIISKVDIENKITYGLANHFSEYLNTEQYFLLNVDLQRRQNNHFTPLASLITPFDEILPIHQDSPFANAEEIIDQNDGMQNCFIRLTFDLWKRDKTYGQSNQKIYHYFDQQVATQEFYIKYTETASGWDAYVYRYDNPYNTSNSLVEIFHKSGLTYQQLKDVWLTGLPIAAEFTDNCFYSSWRAFEFLSYTGDSRVSRSCGQ